FSEAVRRCTCLRRYRRVLPALQSRGASQGSGPNAAHQVENRCAISETKTYSRSARHRAGGCVPSWVAIWINTSTRTSRGVPRFESLADCGYHAFYLCAAALKREDRNDPCARILTQSTGALPVCEEST